MTVEAADHRRRYGIRVLTRVRIEIWGLLDHALVSGVNFFTLILLARALTQRDFGYFVLAFTMLQSAGRFQAAFITGPHNVLGVRRRGAEYVRYTGTTLVVQSVFAVAVGGLVVAATGVAYLLGFTRPGLFFAAVPTLFAWQLQDMTRRILYTERRLSGAFANDVLTYGGQACALVVLWRSDSLSEEVALYTLAVAFSVGAVIGLWQLRRSLSATFDMRSFLDTWHFGKWLGAAEASYWFSSQFYIYLAGAVLGSVASGVLKVSQSLLGPIAVFQAFFTNFLPIKFADSVPLGNVSRSARELRRIYFAIIPVTIAYCAFVAAAAGPLLRLLYGAEYESSANVVRLFALYYVLLAVSLVIVASLTARELTRDIFLANACGGVVSVAFGWILLSHWGPSGGVVGMILSSIVITALLARAHLLAALRRRLHEDLA